MPFMKWRGWGLLRGGTSVSLNASTHKEQECIWFCGGVLNSLWDNIHFMK